MTLQDNIYILTVQIFDIRPRVSLIDLYLHTSFCWNRKRRK